VSPTRRLARPLLAAPFVLDGVAALRSPASHEQDVRDAGLPEPEKVVQAASAAKVVAGFLLATGRFSRVSSLVLVGAAGANAAVHHPFWKQTDPARKTEVRLQFVRDLGLLGGALVAAADTGGRESVPHAAARITRRTKRKAATQVAKAEKRATVLARKAERRLPSR
jgi:putative oxidoreductase